MRKSRFHIAIVALFIIGQCFAVVHAAEFGFGPHEHDGAICSIATLEDDYDVAFSSPEVFQFVTELQIGVAQACFTDYSSFLYFSPPATGPPAVI